MLFARSLEIQSCPFFLKTTDTAGKTRVGAIWRGKKYPPRERSQFLESCHRLYVVGMGKHINRLDLRNEIVLL
jgi:hypothetical protein